MNELFYIPLLYAINMQHWDTKLYVLQFNIMYVCMYAVIYEEM